MENTKLIVWNKLKAIRKVMEEIKKKNTDKEGENTGFLHALTKAAGQHDLTNTTLLRRFANPVKDPDPLASTMISLSYKYPIMVKIEYANEKLKEDREKYQTLITAQKDDRKPGWIACKKELVEDYLTTCEKPLQPVIDTIELLHLPDSNKMAVYNSIPWPETEINVGVLTAVKERVKLAKPLVEGVPASDIILLIGKILQPHLEVKRSILNIYEQIKDTIPKYIPQSLGIMEQVSALINVFDSKERFIPKISSFESSYFQIATMLYSNRWQLAEVKDLPKTSKNKLSLKRNIDGLCQNIVHLMYLYELENPLQLAANVGFDSKSLRYHMEDDESHANYTNYLKALCHVEALNIYTFSTKFGSFTLRFITARSLNMEREQEIHFVTNITQGRFKMTKLTCEILMRWSAFSEIETIVKIFFYIFKLYQRGVEFYEDVYVAAFSYCEEDKEFKNVLVPRSNIYQGRINYWENERAKMNSMTLTTISKNTSHMKVIIDDSFNADDPVKIKEIGTYGSKIPRFDSVNGVNMVNISNFITSPPFVSDENCELLDTTATCMYEHNYAPFLRIINFVHRFKGIFKNLFFDSNLMSRVLLDDYYLFSYLFKNDFEEIDFCNLQHTCRTYLRNVVKNAAFESVRKEMMALCVLFRGPGVGVFKKTFRTKQGFFVDLVFEQRTQNTNNVLWIDQEGQFRVFEETLNSSIEAAARAEIIVSVYQDRFSGYRFEVACGTIHTEIFPTLDRAIEELSNKVSGSFVYAYDEGNLLKVIRDTRIRVVTSNSNDRLLKALKRSSMIPGPSSRKPRLQ
uniref:PB2 n=1 Tax=Bemisia tabaci Quaranja-like virus 2 TaxID=2840015 RepID=A0A8E8FTS4_9ORTO|nr:PB2 [Bemisia tabaci Quaranja-like virus 2]